MTSAACAGRARPQTAEPTPAAEITFRIFRLVHSRSGYWSASPRLILTCFLLTLCMSSSWVVEIRRRVRAQHFDGDLAVVLQIVGEVDVRHATFA